MLARGVCPFPVDKSRHAETIIYQDVITFVICACEMECFGVLCWGKDEGEYVEEEAVDEVGVYCLLRVYLILRNQI